MADLYGRVTARGFPSSVAAGMTGAGALESQGSPQDPAHGQATSAAGQYTTLTGFAPEAPPPPAVDLLEGTWGLPGTLTDPDQTPQAHAAPVPGWAGSYAPSDDLDAVHGSSAEIHSKDFGALTRHVHVTTVPDDLSQWTSSSEGENVLQPVRGQLQAMGGRDKTQGYGLANRYGFDSGHRDRIVATEPQPMAYLDPAERPFVIPQASGTFTPTDAVQGPAPFTSGWDAGDVNATPPSDYQPPPEPATLSAAQAGAPAAAGWW